MNMIEPATNDQWNPIQAIHRTAEILKDFCSCFRLEIWLSVLGANDKMIKQLMMVPGN
ncbi:MAG TPA: hypothetical protein VM260_12995 [Pirellula sp.]|nr:hypothetical protein [Pirellula sp.]